VVGDREATSPHIGADRDRRAALVVVELMTTSLDGGADLDSCGPQWVE
jgi:hypothetical protein